MLKVAVAEKKVPDGVAEAVAKYKDIKAQMTFLESQLKPIKDTLEVAASQMPDGTIITEAFKIALTIAQRENFSLKNAKAALGEDALKPFISISTYSMLRVS